MDILNPTTLRAALVGASTIEQDDFVLNDIPLDIPPTQIKVTKQGQLQEYLSLRTQHPQKIPTGHGAVHVSITVYFSGNDSINYTLRPLVAGLRAAPFCAVYNNYLKQQLQNLDSAAANLFSSYSQVRPIVLAWTSMSFSTIQGMPDTLVGQFEFIWFNYLPFTPVWAYKAGDGSAPGPCFASEIWKEFYRPYLNQSTPVNWPHDVDGQKMTTIYYRRFMKSNSNLAGQQAAQDLAKSLQDSPEDFLNTWKNVLGDGRMTPQNSLDLMYEYLAKEGKVPKQDVAKIAQGDITAAGAETLYPLLLKLGPQVAQGIKNAAAISQDVGVKGAYVALAKQIAESKDKGMEQSSIEGMGWKPIQNLAISLDMKDDRGNPISLGKSYIYQRIDNISLGPKTGDFVIESFSFSFVNNLAIIPMAGHSYPTCQYMGGSSIEAQIKLSGSYTDIEELQSFYDNWTQTCQDWKAIPQGFLNVFVENDFFQLFGFKEFLLEALMTQTQDGQPGRSAASLILTTAGVTSRTTFEDPIYDNPEKLGQEKIMSHAELRKEVYEILTKGMEIYPYEKKSEADGSSEFNRLVKEAVDAYNTFQKQVLSKVMPSMSYGSRPHETTGKRTTVDQEYYHTLMDSDELSPYAPGLNDVKRSVEGIIKSNRETVAPLHRVRGAINYKQLTGGSTQYDDNSHVTPDLRQSLQSQAFARRMMGQSGQGLADRLSSKSQVSKADDQLQKKIDLGIYKYSQTMTDFVDRIIANYLGLDEFKHLKALAGSLGLNKGSMAYPDFYDSLRAVATWVEGQSYTDNSLLSYDPDTYLWYPLHDGSTSSSAQGTYIGADLINAAQKHSTLIYDNMQTNLDEFFGTYKKKLQTSAYQVPFETLKKGIDDSAKDGLKSSTNGLSNPFYEKKSWSSSSQNNDGEEGKIKKSFVFDPSKVPVNSYEAASNVMGCSDVITQNTDLNVQWNGVITETGTGDRVSRTAPSTTGIPSNSQLSWMNLGVEPVQFSWPDDSAQTPNQYGLVCPMETFKLGEPVKIRPIKNFAEDILNGCRKFETMWKTSAHIFQRDGYRWTPEMCAKDMGGKSVSSWTVADYQTWLAKGRGRQLGRMHQGLDLGAPLGTPIYAIANGTVRYVTHEPIKYAGLWISLAHNSSKTGGIGGSRYMHLQAIKSGLSVGKAVKAGECIGLCGHSGYASSKYVHLHFETWTGPATKPIGQGYTFLDPQSTQVPFSASRHSAKRYSPPAGSAQAKKLEQLKSQDVPTDVTSEVVSPLKLAIREFEIEALKGQTQRLVRAYPAFKLYFIEDDSGDRANKKRVAFDDFFSYNSLRSIRVVKSRKIAADLCVLEIINVSGTLSNRKFRSDSDPPVARDSQGNKVSRESTNPGDTNTAKENPIASLLLQEGIGIHLKMGYCVDERTEILTKRGWLQHHELTTNDIALTLNHESGLSEWKPVKKVNRFNTIDEEMVSIDGYFHSSLTTLDHNWPVLHRKKIQNQYQRTREWVTSKSFRKTDFIIGGALCSELPKEKKWEDALVETLAWFATEGTINNKGKNKNPSIVISQSRAKNPENITRIVSALTKLLGPSCSTLGVGNRWGQNQEKKWRKKSRPNRGETEFRLNAAASKIFLDIAPNRVVSFSFIQELTKEQLELFLYVFNKGDGHYSYQENPPFTISQKNKDSLVAVELAAILLGYRTHLQPSNQLSVDRNGNTYCMTMLHISTKPTVGLGDLSVGPTRVKYTGVTWCPTTENKSWLARRDGCVYYTGNSSDPDLLDVQFTGQITAVEFSENEDLVTVIAQSYATELVQDRKGIEEPLQKSSSSLGPWSFLGFADHASTGRIIEEMLAEPEVLHFGRWERQDSSGDRDLLCNKWRWMPTPADDNIFAPPFKEDMILGEGLFVKTLRYVIQNTTIWDICQEMTLRHPNFICSPVPYTDQYGERMTLFFGLPSHLYFARYPSQDEKEVQDKLKKIQKDMEELENPTRSYDKMKDPGSYKGATTPGGLVGASGGFLDSTKPTSIGVTPGALVNSKPQEISRPQQLKAQLQKQRLALACSAGYIKPFRKYHLVTSGNHIVVNNIRTASQNVANTIAIQYPDKAVEAGRNITKLPFQDVNSAPTTLMVKLDNALPAEDMRTQVCQFMNVFNPTMARRYGLSMLIRNCKEIYTGDLVILGNGSIKPYDVVYIMDQASDMVGAIEVEQTIQTFTHETGWVTEITPDMICVAAEYSLLSAVEALGIVMEGFFRQTSSNNYSPTAVSPIAQALAVGTNLFGGFLTEKLINFTQYGHPVIMSPLSLHGKPFTGGVPTRKIPTSLFETVFGKYSPLDNLHYESWKTDFWDGINQSITKVTGGYAQGSITDRLKPWGGG